MKRPSLQWYPNDWMNDIAVRQCSTHARAVWVDLICLMHHGSPYGYLRDGAGPLAAKFVAQKCNVTVKELASALVELEKREVFSKAEDGSIYSRRMVRDEQTRALRAAGGPKSLDNPKVPKPKAKDTHKSVAKDIHEGHPSRISLPPVLPVEEEEEDEEVTKTENREVLVELWEFFRLTFVGEIEVDAMEELGLQMYSDERIELMRENLPLWMRTGKYSRGYGKGAKWFIRSGIWMQPPREQLLEDVDRKKPDVHDQALEILRQREARKNAQ